MDSLVAVGGTLVGIVVVVLGTLVCGVGALGALVVVDALVGVVGGIVLGALVVVVGGGELFVVVLNAHMFLLYFYFIF